MIRPLTSQDYERWLELAAEVEPLFGAMVSDTGFRVALRETIAQGNALGLEVQDAIGGIIAIDRVENEITWLAVGASYRGCGYGDQLVKAALEELAADSDVQVQTFAPEVSAGSAARHLYLRNGFVDARRAGPNPAGLETVMMRRPCS